MCGICGLCLLNVPRTPSQWDELRNIFTRLLVANEARGPYSTGVATMNLAGEVQLYKDIVPASQFVKRPKFQKIIGAIDSSTTIIMGHTRWPTVGPVTVLNAQPMLVNKSLVGAVNGTLTNYNYFISKYNLHPKTQSDSEVLFLLTDKAFSQDIWIQNISEILRCVEGNFATVMVTTKMPNKILILQRDKPLAMAWMPEFEALVYSSDIFHLNVILGQRYCQPIDLSKSEKTQFYGLSTAHSIGQPGIVSSISCISFMVSESAETILG